MTEYDSLHSTVLGRVSGRTGKKCKELNMVSMMLTVIHSPGAKNNQVPRDPHFRGEMS